MDHWILLYHTLSADSSTVSVFSLVFFSLHLSLSPSLFDTHTHTHTHTRTKADAIEAHRHLQNHSPSDALTHVRLHTHAHLQKQARPWLICLNGSLLPPLAASSFVQQGLSNGASAV